MTIDPTSRPSAMAGVNGERPAAMRARTPMDGGASAMWRPHIGVALRRERQDGARRCYRLGLYEHRRHLRGDVSIAGFRRIEHPAAGDIRSRLTREAVVEPRAC